MTPDPPHDTAEADRCVLDVRGLRVRFHGLHGEVEAVRGVDFTLQRGQTLALVGESGSGKSVTSYSLLHLLPDSARRTADRMVLHGRDGTTIDLASLREGDAQLRRVRGGRISMIFQEPMTALSPVHTVGNQVVEAVRLHRDVTHREAWAIAEQMIARVGIPDPAQRMKQYPFEFSGGMRQRVVIAMALVCRPDVLIADEPTTALDVTVQAQVLTLIDELKREFGTSVIFITHDLSVVAQIADQIVVMQHGRVVESGPKRAILARPYHPYTHRLLSGAFAMEPDATAPIRGTLPAEHQPAGWGFEPADADGPSPTLTAVGEGRRVLLWPPAGQREVAHA
jgi:ABC-type dipeptide/oligopeptide/nickel transport system ATPase component